PSRPCSSSCLMLVFFFYCYRHHPDLPSFPTRRSSDLVYEELHQCCLYDRLGEEKSSQGHDDDHDHHDHEHIVRGVVVQENNRGEDRKSTRLNSSHVKISYAVFCLKKKKKKTEKKTHYT